MKEIYQHYKGGFYEKITEANSEAFDIPLVVYRSLKDGKQWVRAKALFDEKFTLVAIAENHYYCPNCQEYHPLEVERIDSIRAVVLCDNCQIPRNLIRTVIKKCQPS